MNEKLIEWIEKTRKRDINNVDKIDMTVKEDRQLYFYIEGRICAFSDALLKIYYDKEEK